MRLTNDSAAASLIRAFDELRGQSQRAILDEILIVARQRFGFAGGVTKAIDLLTTSIGFEVVNQLDPRSGRSYLFMRTTDGSVDPVRSAQQ